MTVLGVLAVAVLVITGVLPPVAGIGASITIAIAVIAVNSERHAKALEALVRIEAGREARVELMLHGTDTTADRQDLDR